MTYDFPASLHPLRDFLKSKGFDGDAVKTSRQAAFVAQQLLGTRVKFPSKGSDMTSTLLLIQKALGGGAVAKGNQHEQPRSGKGNRQLPFCKKPKHHKEFTPDLFSEGIHIFCDGAAVPNPGAGGWAWVMYIDGQEFSYACGGDPHATNNQMELTAILNAIEKAKKIDMIPMPKTVTVWSDSQYCVKGINEWRHGWKAKGWARGGPNSDLKNRILLNADLWKAIDEGLLKIEGTQIIIHWVKGHHGIAGNERADELAELGRQEAIELGADLRSAPADDLDAQYRSIMAG